MRTLNIKGPQGYVFQEGAVMSPEALAVGEHTLSWTVTSPNFEAFTMTTF